MDRRTFIGAITSALVSASSTLAQQQGQLFRLGWLSASPYAKTPLWEVFIGAMRELGWIEGRNFTVENLVSEGHSERLAALAAELVQRKVDLIVAGGTSETAAARNATTTIPIVFFYVGDPIGSGFIASIARPGGNITGLGGLGPGLHAKQLALLNEAVPMATRIATMINPDFPLHRTYRAEVEPVARALGLTLRQVEVRLPEDIDGAFGTIAREQVDALLIFGQPLMFRERDRVARLALERRLPAMVPFGELAHAGVLLSYGPRLVDDVRRLPYYIDRILKGTNPGELPVEQPTRFYLTVNLDTAKVIGLTLPQSLLARADEVIR